MKKLLVIVALLGACACSPDPARAWGDEGHMIVALIADRYLDAPTRQAVARLLADDHTGLVPERSMASEALWADRYRDSDRDLGRERYEQTRRWHYVDLELRSPDLSLACFGRRPLPAGVAAAAGPAEDCAVDKIEQFAAELRSPRTPAPERLLALQFLLHLVGDVHQPLHAIDDHDEGGNRERVYMRGQRTGSLHQYWDSEFVQALGQDPSLVAAELAGQISAADLATWRRGDAADWARESYSLAKAYGYETLPSPHGRGRGRYELSAAYATQAESVVALQLERAGVRLAMLLERCLH